MQQSSFLRICFILVIALLNFNNGLKLPAYITPCPKADHQKLNECAKINGQKAIPHFVKGDPKYKIPVLDPFEIERVEIEESRDLKISLEKVLIGGLKDGKIDFIDIDLEKKEINVTITIPKLDIRGKYTVDGKILILPITGNGPFSLEIFDGSYSIHFDQEYVTKNGKEYIKIKNVDVDFSVGNHPAKLQLDNLFNGHEQLGKDANKFLNANWKEVVEILKPAIVKTVASIFKNVGQNILETVEFENIFT